MGRTTLYVPDELYAEMKKQKNFSWSGLFRRAVRERLHNGSPESNLVQMVQRVDAKVDRIVELLK